ncbi:hypothetical protein DDE18_20130 [Nocardioides gansuensis]|uniref:Uncharacterized protein n=1 Tax=Nocardioides gansuensis TaxID=2138300 RepID=A0A2T8F5Y9_9ACTN|nr:hypothetical protein DDE18_20130 [Nocardioides gansuensis]
MSCGLELEALMVGQDAAVDGVVDPAFEAASGFLGGFVFGDLASVVVVAGTGIARLVMAATWMPALRCRFTASR